MSVKPTYEELEQRVKELEKETFERKRTEEDLSLQKRRFESLIEYSSLAIVTLDEGHNIVSCNRDFEKIFHYKESEIVGKNLDALIADHEYIEDAISYAKQTLRGKSIHGSGKRKRKDGTYIDVQFTGVPVIIDGKVIGAYAIYQDISERKRAEEALRESEEKYRSTIESIEDGYYEVDISGNLTFFNNSLCKIFELTEKELMGKNFGDFVDQENAKKGYQAFNKVYTTGKSVKGFGWEIITKDGTKGYVEASVSLRKDSEGQPIGYQGIIREISKQKQAEESLKESEERYRGLVEKSFDGIFVQKGHKIIFTNQRLNEMLGYEEGELFDLDHWLIYHPDYQDLTRERAQARMRGEPVEPQYEVKLQGKDGSWLYGEISTRVISLGGEPGIQVWIKDITERKQAEEALRENEERLQAIFESNPSPMVAYDTEGHAQYVNPAFTKLFGWSLDELKGRRIPFVPDDQKKITGKKLDEVYSTGKNVQFETKRLTRQGDIIDVIVSGAYIKGLEGEPVQMIANLTDISERKKLEVQLQQAQRMEALGTLAGGIAHDFNNLLMGIQGRTSLILMDKDSSHPDFRHLKGIEDYVKNAADLAKQLLGFARGGKYEVKPTDINELIKKSSRMFGRTKKEIKIHGKYQEDVWAVEADQGQIEQVLMNLYVNAWQAMPGGGGLYLQTENVTIDEDYVKPFKIEPGRYVKISVTDTGVGMDKATRQRIFDPFFTTKEMGRGTGLGLASAYGIIKNHSGFINVYSEKGEGTTFNIYLPASESEIRDQKSEVSEDVGHGAETVLLIDDEDMIIDVGGQLLEKMGYTVLIARSGKEAVDTYEKNKDEIDIVILDMIMPDMSGGDTFDRLREIDPDIKVLLSSGYSINGQATEILDRGCNGFIQKPFNMKQLSRKIREVLDKG